MDRLPDTDPERDGQPSPESGLPHEPTPALDPVDEVVAGSFPASDPPQWWAGKRD